MERKIFYKPYVAGISATIPKERCYVCDLPFDAELISKIESTTGIHTIRVSPKQRTSVDYCADAAKRLLGEMKISTENIDALIYVTTTPDYIMPGTGHILHKKIGLSGNCIVTDISQACSGFMMGLFHAFLYIESGICENVLLCAGDTPTKYVNPQDRSLRMVVGDGGSAALVSKSVCPLGGGSCFSFSSDGGGVSSLCISERGAFMDGMAVMLFAINNVPVVVKNVMDMTGWSMEDIDVFVFHQANEFMVQGLGKRLRCPSNKLLVSVDGIGNTASATIPIALCNSRESKLLAHKNKMVLCGYGAGFSCIGGALDMSETELLPLAEI